MAEQNSGLLDRDGSLFPLVERNTPIMDRIRRFRNGEETVVTDFAEASARHILVENGTEEADQLNAEGAAAIQAYREALASELGVPKEAIEDDIVETFGRLYAGLNEEDVVDEQVLNILNGDLPADVEEDEDGGLSLSSDEEEE